MARGVASTRIARVAAGACVVGVLLPAAGLAQATAGGVLTLEAALDRAFAHNPSLVAARLGRVISTAGVAVASERPNPEATVEIEKETPKHAFGVGVPIELGGKRAKRIALGQATVRAGDAELAATMAQVRHDVRRAYFEVLVAGLRRTVLHELRDVSQRARDAAQARFESGDAPRLEVVQADLRLHAAANDSTSAEGAVVAATAAFNALLGLPLETTQQLAMPLDTGRSWVATAMLDVARRDSVELAAIDRRIDEQRAKLTLARALRTPDAVPSATLTHDAQPEFSYGWRVGLAISLPLFTTHAAGVTVEEATLSQLVAQREATRLRIEGDVTAAATMAETQRLAYARYRDLILPEAQDVEQLAEESYRLGQTGIAALLQALQDSRDVRLRSLDTLSQYQASLADLERAMGTALP